MNGNSVPLRGITLVLASTVPLCTLPDTPADESDTSEIEYSSVAEARAALAEKPEVTLQIENGWTIARDSINPVVWLFVPPDHPAYPSVIKRSVVNRNSSGYMMTSIKCEASKDVCDKYFASE